MDLQGSIEQEPFTDKAIQQRNPGDTAGPNQPQDHGSRHAAAQAAELVHVARAAGMLHPAGTKKKAGLEESVIQAVQKAGRDGQRSARSESQHHVPDLAYCAVCQQALQVLLRQAEERANQQDDVPTHASARPQDAGQGPNECIRAIRYTPHLT